MHKGYLDGYLLHRTCVFKALRLFFLQNFPGPTFIPCSTSILKARVSSTGLCEHLNLQKMLLTLKKFLKQCFAVLTYLPLWRGREEGLQH